jgi:opacity protein-like surface antigen
MSTLRSVAVAVVVALVFIVVSAPPAQAFQGEISFVIGALVGGDFEALISADDISLTADFKNAPLYGARLGWFGYPLGIEGSLVYSPSGLSGSLQESFLTIDTRVIYLEANAVLIILPGPISPYITGGLGLHSFDFKASVAQIDETFSLGDINKLGYNIGAGLKFNLSRISIRAEVRDHFSRFKPEDFVSDPALGELLGIDAPQNLHNLEISGSVGIRF